MSDHTRRDMRTPITLKIKFKSSNLDQFIERYSVDVSRGGIFIRTKEPLPVGTQLRFEFQLQDASSLIAGDGTVVWIREHDPARQGVAPGMGVRFDKLASRVAEGARPHPEREAQARRRADRVALRRGRARVGVGVGDVVVVGSAAVRAQRLFGRRLPHGTRRCRARSRAWRTPDDEFGNESTRVMQNELVQSLADRTRGQAEHAANAFSDPEPTRKASIEELKLAVQGSAIETGRGSHADAGRGRRSRSRPRPAKDGRRAAASRPSRMRQSRSDERAAEPSGRGQAAPRPRPKRA